MSKNKLLQKLTKVNESYTVNQYDNGFMIEVSGRDSENDWKTSKILCNNIDEVVELVREIATMPRDD